MTIHAQAVQELSGIDSISMSDRISDEVSRLFNSTFSLIERDRATALEMIRNATHLLELGAGEFRDDGETADGAQKGGLAPWQAIRIEQYIDAGIDRKLTAEELAGTVRLSASYFSVAFKATFGLAPHAYIMQRRIAFAKERLAETEHPIAQVALECGFADQAHLSRLFRRFVGVTPSMWRRVNDQRLEHLIGPDLAAPSFGIGAIE